MAYHETALDAIFEDSLSDSEFEDGEIAEDVQAGAELQTMDVDAIDVENVSAEEGEVVKIAPSRAFLDKPEEHGVVVFGIVTDQHATGEAGRGEDLAHPPRQKNKKKKRSGKRAKRVNVAQFVRDTCSRLQEKKYPLVWAAVKKLGIDGVRDLVKEVDVIEKCGGQMTNDGKRRRTPGGVMWNVLRGRVQPAVYKEIMSQANEVQKQKVKEAKESLKRDRMDVDEPVSNKRQKLAIKEVDMTVPVAQGKQTNQARQVLRPSKKMSHVSDGPERDSSLLPAIQLQRAWVEGIRKKEKSDDAAVVPVNSPGVGSEFMTVGTVAGILSEKRSAPLFERLRVPVEYSDLVKEKAVPSFEKQMVPIEPSDAAEGTLHEILSSQDPE